MRLKSEIPEDTGLKKCSLALRLLPFIYFLLNKTYLDITVFLEIINLTNAFGCSKEQARPLVVRQLSENGQT